MKSDSTQQIFVLDFIRVRACKASGIRMDVSGWYRGPSSSGIPRIRVEADGQSIGQLHFHIPRPDLDTIYGLSKSPRGFQDSFALAFRPRKVTFIFNDDERILLIRIISRFESVSEKPILRNFFKVYERIFLRSTLNKPFSVQRTLRFLRYLMKSVKAVKRTGAGSNSLPPRVGDYEAWVSRNTWPPEMLKNIFTENFPDGKGPYFGLIYRRVKDERRMLQDSLASVLNQAYPHWEICLPVDRDEYFEMPEGFSSRINTVIFDDVGEASRLNQLIEHSEAEFLVIIDADGKLPRHALLCFAISVSESPDAVVWYADEDLLTEEGKREKPWFKPDYDYAGLLSHNYLHRPLAIRRSAWLQAGKFDPGFEGACEYEFLLRMASRNAGFVHIPDVLYHNRRAFPGMFTYQASHVDAKASFKALSEHLAANGQIKAGWLSIQQRQNQALFELLASVATPGVEIIIPACNQHTVTEKCLFSLLSKTSYRNYSVLLIDNDSDDPQALTFYQSVHDHRVRVKRIGNPPEGFSFSYLNNQAVKDGNSEYVLFLNNDTEIVQPDWLGKMVANALTARAGVVGARLLFPDRRVQHAGVFLGFGLEKMPGHCHVGWDSSKPSPLLRVELASEKVAVTAACMLTPRKLFLETGGFNEQDFPVNYNDIDYCIRLRNKGYRVIYCASAILLHHQGLSRGSGVGVSEILAFRRKYNNFPDPFYNPNLLKSGQFEPVPEPGPLTRSYMRKGLRILFYSHNFNFEGAPGVIYDVSIHMAGKGHQVKIIAPYEGSAIRYLNAKGIETAWLATPEVHPPAFLYTKAEGDVFLKDAVSREIRNFQPDVMYVNVLHAGFVVNLAAVLNIPAVWMIHESFAKNEQSQLVPHFRLEDYMAAFRDAAAVVFCTPYSSRHYEQFNVQNNFRIIRNMLKPGFLPVGDRNALRASARRALGIHSRATMVLNVGIIALHKNQELIVRAAALLRNENILFYLVGAREGNVYLDSLRLLIGELGVGENVKVIAETREIQSYYQAADAFCFTSVNETYPYVILEAMASDLPIVTTPVNGVNEQVRFGENALRADYSDPDSLARHIYDLHVNPELRVQMGKKSGVIFDYLNDFDEMMLAHEHCILESQLHSQKVNLS